MAKTFTQLYVQTVFAVRGRQSLIKTDWRERFYQYTTGIVRGKGQKLLATGGMGDHVHILIGLKPTMAISDLVRDVKANSTNFINDNNLIRGRFRWQEGFGAFTTHTRSWIQSLGILELRSGIIKGKHFVRNPLNYYKNLIYPMMKNTCLIGWRISIINNSNWYR